MSQFVDRNAMLASEPLSLVKQAQPHHLQIVTKVTEQRAPAPKPFHAQQRPPAKARAKSHGYNGKRANARQLKDNIQSVLKVGQVKVNQ